jgi:hypothetical protein
VAVYFFPAFAIAVSGSAANSAAPPINRAQPIRVGRQDAIWRDGIFLISTSFHVQVIVVHWTAEAVDLGKPK